MAEKTPQPDKQGESDDMATREDPMVRAHKRTYEGFVRLLTYSAVGVAVVLILMALFLL